MYWIEKIARIYPDIHQNHVNPAQRKEDACAPPLKKKEKSNGRVIFLSKMKKYPVHPLNPVNPAQKSNGRIFFMIEFLKRIKNQS